MTTPPPPTIFARLDTPQAIVDRLTNLWRLAATDDQRWEVERLAEELGTWLEAQEEIDWDSLAEEASTAAADAAAEVIRNYAPTKPKAVLT